LSGKALIQRNNRARFGPTLIGRIGGVLSEHKKG